MTLILAMLLFINIAVLNSNNKKIVMIPLIGYNPMESKTIYDYVFKAPNLIFKESTHQSIHICLQENSFLKYSRLD